MSTFQYIFVNLWSATFPFSTKTLSSLNTSFISLKYLQSEYFIFYHKRLEGKGDISFIFVGTPQYWRIISLRGFHPFLYQRSLTPIHCVEYQCTGVTCLLRSDGTQWLVLEFLLSNFDEMHELGLWNTVSDKLFDPLGHGEKWSRYRYFVLSSSICLWKHTRWLKLLMILGATFARYSKVTTFLISLLHKFPLFWRTCVSPYQQKVKSWRCQ